MENQNVLWESGQEETQEIDLGPQKVIYFADLAWAFSELQQVMYMVPEQYYQRFDHTVSLNRNRLLNVEKAYISNHPVFNNLQRVSLKKKLSSTESG